MAVKKIYQPKVRMMKNKNPRFQSIAAQLDLPEDIAKDGYHIEIMNDCAVVDGCKNVAEYGDGIIRLNVGGKIVSVIGCNLTIKSFFCGQVTVTGRIAAVEIG